MNTNARIDALNAAIAESKATLYDLHKADYAVDSLISEVCPKPWTYTTTSKAHVVELQLKGCVKSVKRVWSWYEFRFVYKVTVRG